MKIEFEKDMKKWIFWLLTDIMWFILYIPIVYGVLKDYLISLGLTGDGRMVILFDLSLFIFVNTFFVLTQNLCSCFFLKETDVNYNKYLRIKKRVFIVHVIVLNLLNLIAEIIHYIKNEPNALEWLYNFSLCIAVPIVIYVYMVKELGKRVEWVK